MFLLGLVGIVGVVLEGEHSIIQGLVCFDAEVGVVEDVVLERVTWS